MKMAFLDKKEAYFLVSLFILSLVLKLGVALATSKPSGELLVGDIPGYLSLAESLYRDHRFGEYTTENVYTPNLIRTPIYPLFIAAHKPFFGDQLLGLYLTQSVLTSLLIFWVYGMAKKMAGTLAAGFAAVSMTFDPSILHFSLLPLTESFFSFLWVLAAWMLYRAWEKGSIARALLAAFLFSLSALTRPIALFIFLFFLPVFLWFPLPRPKRVLLMVLWILLFIAPVMGWIARNGIVADTPVFSSISSVNMLYYRGAGVKSKLEGIPWTEAKDQLSLEIQQYRQENHPSEYELLQYMNEKGVAYILHHPLLYAWVHGEGILYLLFGPSMGFIFSRFGYSEGGMGLLTAVLQGGVWQSLHFVATRNWGALAMSGLEFAYCLALVGLGVYAVCNSSSFQKKPFVLLLIASVYLIILSGGPEAGSRFRVPLLPFLLPLAGGGLQVILEKWKGREKSLHVDLRNSPGDNPHRDMTR